MCCPALKSTIVAKLSMHEYIALLARVYDVNFAAVTVDVVEGTTLLVLLKLFFSSFSSMD